MELKFLHFYPDLMNLYGSYANVSLLRRTLEGLGHTVTVEAVTPGTPASLEGADFLFMGAGTERAQKAALADFRAYGPAVCGAAQRGMPQLYCGTAMELLGRTVTDSAGQVYQGIGLADFETVQGEHRFTEDVYGHTGLYGEAVVGFINKCSLLEHVDTPLLTSLALGFGNQGAGTAEGFRRWAVTGSHLTGPLLVKNPQLLKIVISDLYAFRGEAAPESIELDRWLEDGYAITAEQLKLRSEK